MTEFLSLRVTFIREDVRLIFIGRLHSKNFDKNLKASCVKIPNCIFDQRSACASHSLIRLFPVRINNNDPVDTQTAKRENSGEKTLISLFECTG